MTGAAQNWPPDVTQYDPGTQPAGTDSGKAQSGITDSDLAAPWAVLSSVYVLSGSYQGRPWGAGFEVTGVLLDTGTRFTVYVPAELARSSRESTAVVGQAAFAARLVRSLKSLPELSQAPAGTPGP